MTASFETIRLETDQRRIARLTLNRPDKHNVFNAAMIGELTEAAKLLAADQSVRAVVLSGAGQSFCAGGDLGWMQAQFEADRAQREAEALRLATMLGLLDELPKLLIAVVHGQAYGGGAGLASVCDIVLALQQTKFALTETRLGLVPATISPFVVRRIGLANIRRVALNGHVFDADEAQAMGLVSHVHSEYEIDAALDVELDLALACAPGAIAAAKQLFRGVATGSLARVDTAKILADRWDSVEARAGVGAFFKREKPPWAP